MKVAKVHSRMHCGNGTDVEAVKISIRSVDGTRRQSSYRDLGANMNVLGCKEAIVEELLGWTMTDALSIARH